MAVYSEGSVGVILHNHNDRRVIIEKYNHLKITTLLFNKTMQLYVDDILGRKTYIRKKLYNDNK